MNEYFIKKEDQNYFSRPTKSTASKKETQDSIKSILEQTIKSYRKIRPSITVKRYAIKQD